MSTLKSDKGYSSATALFVTNVVAGTSRFVAPHAPLPRTSGKLVPLKTAQITKTDCVGAKILILERAHGSTKVEPFSITAVTHPALARVMLTGPPVSRVQPFSPPVSPTCRRDVLQIRRSHRQAEMAPDGRKPVAEIKSTRHVGLCQFNLVRLISPTYHTSDLIRAVPHGFRGVRPSFFPLLGASFFSLAEASHFESS